MMANPNWKLFLLRTMIIVSAGFWIYSPALNGDWLWDDDTDIVHNSLLQSLSGLHTIWFEPSQLSAYYPITFSVEWIEWHLWGATSAGFHLVTFLFHLLNGLLVWRLLDKLGLRLGWLGGLLFVIHPMNVESVAWMVELKNTLSLTPFLLSMCAWVDFEAQHRNSDYWRSWLLFLIAMLCKTTAMMFPFVILLYAWWKQGRIGWSAIRSSLPFFPISLVLCFATTFLQHHHSTLTSDIPLGGLFSRLACAGLTLSFYFSKFFLPIGLMPIYPQWNINPPTLLEFLPWLFVAAVFLGLWSKRKRWSRPILFGLGFFVLNLAPVLGFSRFSYMGFTWVMDHFLYIPCIGLIGLTVAAIGQIEGLLPIFRRPLWMALASVAMVLLMIQAHLYAAIFSNPKALWTYALQYNDAAWPAHDNLGNELFIEGRIDEAVVHYQRALSINSNRFEAHNNLGLALSLRGRNEEAIAEYAKSLAIKSDYAMAHVNMADTLVKVGRIAEARVQYEEALKIDPGNGGAQDRLSKLQSIPPAKQE